MRRPYRPRWPLLLALVAGVGAIIGFAYLPNDDPSGETVPPRGGSYVEGVAGAPATPNPLFASFNDVDRDLTSLVFAGLMRLGASGEVQPDLAESMKVTPDGLTYIFTLRPSLQWQDGARLTSADVVFTAQLIQDPGFAGDQVLAGLYRDVQVEATDERTVTMTLLEPFAPFPARAATAGILPQHLLAGVDAASLEGDAFNRQPVGSGPFRLVSFSTAAAVLEPFAHYYLGEALLQRFELRFYRDDAALLNALLNEEIDGALFRQPLQPDEIALIDSDAMWVRRPLHKTTYSLVYLNEQLPLFQQRQTRRALQHAIDRQTLIENVLAGQALPTDSPIARDLWSSVAKPESYAYNQALAEQLLEADGWQQSDEGRVNNGVPLRFSLAASDDPTQVAVAQELARQWAQVGVQVSVQVSGASEFVEGVLIPRQFEAALVSVEPGPDPDPYPLWHSSQVFGEGRNLATFSNADVDRLLENARMTASAAERATEYGAFQDIFADEAPAVLLYTPTYQYVVRSNVQGLGPGLLVQLSSRFGDVYRWFVETGGDGQ